MLDARKEGEWAVYRDGKLIITEKKGTWFCAIGDIILLGYFNVWTKDGQTTMYGEVMVQEVSLKQQDMSEATDYGKHFLELRSVHIFVIYNGLSQLHM